MRRALLCVAACSCALSTVVVSGQVRTFPYEAVVETDGTPLHSGPGFYATNRLKKGDHVVVQRHDPGGWFMITPPPGEFSLVKSSALRDLGNGMSEVIATETSARVGSRVGNDIGVEQIPLTQGERVKLMSAVATPPGWTAIQPPRGEYRWISGRFVVPVLPMARVEHDADPFSVPTLAKRPETFDDAYVEYESRKPTTTLEGPSLTLGAPESMSSPPKNETGAVMRNLDRELEGLTLTEPTEWPVAKLTAAYERLKQEAPGLGRQIDVRLTQLAKMQLVKSHYSDYVQLTSATDERDALLLASGEAPARRMPLAQAGNALPVTTAAAPRGPAAPSQGALTPVPMAPPAEPANGISGPVLGLPETSGTQVASPRPQPTTPPQSQNALQPPQKQPQTVATSSPQPKRFDAVGVVQRAVDSSPDAPKYVLVAPNGRILVYLQEPKGVSFSGFVGQAMGVDGESQRVPSKTTPMIAVERLTPVRL